MLDSETQRKIDFFLSSNKKIVLATGVFDVLHLAHIHFLEKARKEGDCLVVGVESDSRVRVLKGLGRPINSQDIRIHNLQRNSLADLVFLLPEQFSNSQDHESLIAHIRPHVLAVSSHTPFLKEKQRILQKYDGEVKQVFDHDPQISSSILIEGGRF